MKKVYLLLVCLIATTAYSQNAPAQKSNDRACIENRNLYEPMLMPTKRDSILCENYELLERKYGRGWGFSFNYKYVLHIHGLVDTAKPSNSSIYDYFHQTKAEQYRSDIYESPLVVLGEITDVYNEDTAERHRYSTVIIFKIKEILKSKYKKVKRGDTIAVHVDFRNVYVGGCIMEYYKWVDLNSIFYQKGNTELFVLNKYNYMTAMFDAQFSQSLYKSVDTYCPYSFEMGLGEKELSKMYRQRTITKQEIKALLKK